MTALSIAERRKENNEALTRRLQPQLGKEKYVEPAGLDVVAFFLPKVNAAMELSVAVFNVAGVFVLRCALLGTTLVGTGRSTTPRHAP